jgi:hypothetical protein
LECAPQLVSAASLDCTNAPLTVNATYANGKLTTGTATGYGIFWFADKWQSTASENYYYVLSRPFKVTSGDLSFEAYETEYTQAQYLEDSQKTNQTPSDSATSETTSGSTSTSASSSTSTSTSSSSHKTSTSSGCGNVTGGVAGVGAVAALFALGKRKKNRK